MLFVGKKKEKKSNDTELFYIESQIFTSSNTTTYSN